MDSTLIEEQLLHFNICFLTNDKSKKLFPISTILPKSNFMFGESYVLSKSVTSTFHYVKFVENNSAWLFEGNTTIQRFQND